MKPAFILLAAFGLSACVEEVADGRKIFADECAACHGEDAKGNGFAAAGLAKTPPDLTQIAARNGGIFDVNAVMSTIDGLHHSPDNPMPEFGAGDMGEIIMVDRTPVPAELLALAGYLESIQE